MVVAVVVVVVVAVVVSIDVVAIVAVVVEQLLGFEPGQDVAFGYRLFQPS